MIYVPFFVHFSLSSFAPFAFSGTTSNTSLDHLVAHSTELFLAQRTIFGTNHFVCCLIVFFKWIDPCNKGIYLKNGGKITQNRICFKSNTKLLTGIESINYKVRRAVIRKNDVRVWLLPKKLYSTGIFVLCKPVACYYYPTLFHNR